MNKIVEILKDKEKLQHYFLYILFGVLTTIVDFGTFYLLDRFVPILNENFSNIIAILTSIVFAYFVNREYVFKSKTKDKLKEFSKFFLSRMSSTLFNVAMFWVLTTFTTINEMLIKAIISVVVIILNYIVSKVFVFKEEK